MSHHVFRGIFIPIMLVSVNTEASVKQTITMIKETKSFKTIIYFQLMKANTLWDSIYL